MRRVRLFWLGLMIVVVSLSGCSSADQTRLVSANVVASLSGPADEAFARAYEPIDFVFPRDHGAHPEYRTEWWYYTGNLTDSAGNQYGYQLTFFRSALTPDLPERTSDLATNQIYMAHFAVTNGAANDHQSFERFSRGAGGLAGATGEPAYAVWLEDWAVRTIEPGVTRLQASAPGEGGAVALDLTLRETQPPVLHGKQGLSQKGPEAGNASYYYSLVQIETTGTVTSQGETVEVTGLSWMDHEFGTSALSANAVGWDWFSMQLDNGAVLMLAQVRTSAQWTSPRTQITYPSGWQMAIPRLNIALTVEPLIGDQEMEVSFVYWEGAVTIEGTIADQPVQGVGYVELTGYGQGAGQYQR